MVCMSNVLQWFRDANADTRLEILCRLLDCCTPMELHYLASYLDELLSRNTVFNQCETTPSLLQLNGQNGSTNLSDLREITNSNSRRQLCVLLTRLKSTNKRQAYAIYDVLIHYDFAQFFNKARSLEEEFVDELLLLFTLASNHPAMDFKQRTCLHRRLAELRDTIEKSFECCHVDANLFNNREFVCCNTETEQASDKLPVKSPKTATSSAKNSPTSYIEDATTLCIPGSPNDSKKEDDTSSKSQVHIKDLRVIRVHQKALDKKYEYIFEVTWSNNKSYRIHRAYGELFDFQCKLRRRHQRETGKYTGRRVIPYLPSRKPIKFCKGNDILPDITEYVRDFVHLPEKLLHSDSVENFFSDGNECTTQDEPSQPTIKSSNTNIDKNTNIRQNDNLSLSVEGKADKHNSGMSKKSSMKGKTTIFNLGRKSTFASSSVKLEAKKRSLVIPKETIETSTAIKIESKPKAHAIAHAISVPTTCCRSPLSPDKKARVVRMTNKDTCIKSTENRLFCHAPSSAKTVSPCVPHNRSFGSSVINNRSSVAMVASRKPCVATTTGKQEQRRVAMTSSGAMVTTCKTIPSTMSGKNLVAMTSSSRTPVSITTRTQTPVSMTTITDSIPMLTSQEAVSMTTEQPLVSMATENNLVSTTANTGQVSTTTTQASVPMATTQTSFSIASTQPSVSLTTTRTLVSMTTTRPSVSMTTSRVSIYIPTTEVSIATTTSPCVSIATSEEAPVADTSSSTVDDAQCLMSSERKEPMTLVHTHDSSSLPISSHEIARNKGSTFGTTQVSRVSPADAGPTVHCNAPQPVVVYSNNSAALSLSNGDETARIEDSLDGAAKALCVSMTGENATVPSNETRPVTVHSNDSASLPMTNLDETATTEDSVRDEANVLYVSGAGNALTVPSNGIQPVAVHSNENSAEMTKSVETVRTKDNADVITESSTNNSMTSVVDTTSAAAMTSQVPLTVAVCSSPVMRSTCFPCSDHVSHKHPVRKSSPQSSPTLSPSVTPFVPSVSDARCTGKELGNFGFKDLDVNVSRVEVTERKTYDMKENLSQKLSKNGFSVATNHHPPNGLLIVSNGYDHDGDDDDTMTSPDIVASHGTMTSHNTMTSHDTMTSYDTMMPHDTMTSYDTMTSHDTMTSYDTMTSHDVMTSHDTMTLHDVMTSHDTMTSNFTVTSLAKEPITRQEKIVDKNCNFVSHNVKQDTSWKLSLETFSEFKPKSYVNEKSNGFHVKPFCYNCGECGHSGERCLDLYLDESSVVT